MVGIDRWGKEYASFSLPLCEKNAAAEGVKNVSFRRGNADVYKRQILRSVYKLSGAKKAFALPEDALRKEIEKQNRHRGVFTPTDRKAYYCLLYTSL